MKEDGKLHLGYPIIQTLSELYWILYIELLEIEDKAEDVLKKPYDLDGSLHFSRG